MLEYFPRLFTGQYSVKFKWAHLHTGLTLLFVGSLENDSIGLPLRMQVELELTYKAKETHQGEHLWKEQHYCGLYNSGMNHFCYVALALRDWLKFSDLTGRAEPAPRTY